MPIFGAEERSNGFNRLPFLSITRVFVTNMYYSTCPESGVLGLSLERPEASVRCPITQQTLYTFLQQVPSAF